MLSKEEYIKLYEKYMSGRSSPSELKLLESYEDDFMLKEDAWQGKTLEDKAEVRNRIYRALEAEMLKESSSKPIRNSVLIKWMQYGAAAVLLLALSIYAYHVKTSDLSGVQEEAIVIVPGGNNAVLTTEDGTELLLEDLGIGDITINGNVWANKTSEGELNYASSSKGQVKRHTIRTPRGGQYQITLADGTKVWLNAASSIKFPTAFSDNDRVVEITGEVFFDVKKDDGKPFIVKASDQTVTVLGTQFNIMAYSDEKDIKTSLIQGKVAVDAAGASLILSPGERSVYDASSKKQISKESFDPEEILAWQSGYFMFHEESIGQVMRKIARWYDVEIEYEGDMQGKVFSGTVSRFGEVQEVLDMLTLTGMVSFKIDGRRVLVMG